MRGRIVSFEVESRLLVGNVLGDSPRRRCDVYLPPEVSAQQAPLLVDLVGFTGGGPSHTNFKVLAPTIPQRIDRLIDAGAMPAVAIAFPDCATALGGNQYLDSLGTGRWASFLVEECVPAVEARFGVGGPGRRGVFGKSSGGHGALMHAFGHGGRFWNAVACHSGDMGFPLVYPPMFGPVARTLDKNGRSITAFRQALAKARKIEKADWDVLNLLLQAASFDPRDHGEIVLPFDLHSGVIDSTAWARWMAHDPVEMADSQSGPLNSLKALFIDCGVRDEYNLIFGARQLHSKLNAAGVRHFYEEFDDTHMEIDYRVETSLPFLARALAD
jgi:enterochelin esterase-like enzyme